MHLFIVHDKQNLSKYFSMNVVKLYTLFIFCDTFIKTIYNKKAVGHIKPLFRDKTPGGRSMTLILTVAVGNTNSQQRVFAHIRGMLFHKTFILYSWTLKLTIIYNIESKCVYICLFLRFPICSIDRKADSKYEDKQHILQRNYQT